MSEDLASGSLIRDARRRAGLTQTQLAQRARVTQSVVSAYEAGSRQPSLPVLVKLVEASGLRLDVRLVREKSSLHRLSGPMGRLVRKHRAAMVRTAAQHGATNVRVFGSVARGDDTASSDIDLLVDLAPDTGLLRLGLLKRDLEAILGAEVDLVPAEDLKPSVANEALSEVVPL